MFKYRIILAYILSAYSTLTVKAEGEDLTDIGNEYCQFETFNPKCSSNEIVVIEKAVIGRMKKGKCITDEEIKTSGSFIHDPKYFGCSADVTNVLHERCSFKSECSVKVSDSELKKTNPCLMGLILHMEVDFKCLEVFQTENSHCHHSVSSKPKYFLSESLKNRNCGTTNSPWILEVPKGQRLNAKIVESQKTSCNHVDIILYDGSTRKNYSLCESSYQMPEGSSSNSFKSSNNVVKMFVTHLDSNLEKFLIKFQADGCLDIIPPEDTWLKRTNDDIVIGCYSSKQTWYLRCENGQWTGSIGNCSQSQIQSNGKETEADVKVEKKDVMPRHQQILAIVSIFGMGVVVCSLIICVGAVCARRYSLKKKSQLKLSINAYEQSYNHRTYQPDFHEKFSANQVDQTISRESNPGLLSENDKTYFVLEEDKNVANE